MSVTRTILLEFACYNRWQNEGLYARCGQLDDATRRRGLELFFRSIHRTLDHILHVDHVLLDYARQGRPPTDFRPDTVVHEDFEELRRARARLDRRIEADFEAAEAAWFEGEIRFHSERLGRERAFPRAFVLHQMFNHQTHHRSQVTTALHGLGIDYGETDMPGNPLSRF